MAPSASEVSIIEYAIFVSGPTFIKPSPSIRKLLSPDPDRSVHMAVDRGASESLRFKNPVPSSATLERMDTVDVVM